MKKIMFIMFLCLGFTISSKAYLIENNTACKLCVWVICYDPNCVPSCCIVSETLYQLNPGEHIVVDDCGACTAFKINVPSPDCEHATGPGITVATPSYVQSCTPMCWLWPTAAALPGCGLATAGNTQLTIQ